jgi:hypothetical protein
MKILVKYPTRDRPHLFYPNICSTYLLAKEKENVKFLVSMDYDDITINHDNNKRIQELTGAEIIIGKSQSKIDACNRDMDNSGEWDIVLLLSDDMVCQLPGWDEVIRNAFKDGLDQCVHFNDGFTGQRLMTLALLGRKYYERFGYIYCPDYKSLWCDNEMMDVARKLSKYTYNDKVLFRHIHYSNIGKQAIIDERMRINESYFNIDKNTYHRRRINNFFLKS